LGSFAITGDLCLLVRRFLRCPTQFYRAKLPYRVLKSKNAIVAKTIVPSTITGHAKPAELAMQNAWQDSTARTTTSQS
jgi:hypothetical protein